MVCSVDPVKNKSFNYSTILTNRIEYPISGTEHPDSKCQYFTIVPDFISERFPGYSEARSLVAGLAVEEVGHPAAEVARFPGISRVGVKKAVGRGMQLKKQGLLDG
jgi:hypothetical protein